MGAYCPAPPCEALPLINWHSFLLSDNKFTLFDFPGAEFSRAFAINDRGDIAGVFTDLAGKSHAFLISKREEEGKD